MKKLDRLGWAAALTFEAYGLRIGIRVNRPEALERLTERLPPGARPSPSPIVDRLYSLWLGQTRGSLRGYHLLYAGSARRARPRLPVRQAALDPGRRVGSAVLGRSAGGRARSRPAHGARDRTDRLPRRRAMAAPAPESGTGPAEPARAHGARPAPAALRPASPRSRALPRGRVEGRARGG